MNKYKISEEEFHKVSLTRLANNPSSQSRYSGARLSAEELKMRMDEPLKLFKGKLNAVVSLIFGEGDDSALDHMPTGIKEGHTLAQMIKDVVSTSAEFAGYLSVGEKTLLKKLEEIDKAFEGINKALEGKVDQKTYDEEIKKCLKRIDGEAGIEYAYAQRDGEGRLKPMSLSPTAESIALRGEGGRLKAGTPRDDDDVVTREYADSVFETKANAEAQNIILKRELEAGISDVRELMGGIVFEDVEDRGVGTRVGIHNGALSNAIISRIGGATLLRERNLLPSPLTYRAKSGVISGVTRTVNNDGSVRFYGIAKEKISTAFFYTADGVCPGDGDFILSGCPEGGSRDTYYLQLSITGGLSQYDYGEPEGSRVVIPGGTIGISLVFHIMPGVKVDFTVYPQIERGRRSPWEPWGIRSCVVKRIVSKPKNSIYVDQIVEGGENARITDRGIDILGLDSTQSVSVRLTGLEHGKLYMLLLMNKSNGFDFIAELGGNTRYVNKAIYYVSGDSDLYLTIRTDVSFFMGEVLIAASEIVDGDTGDFEEQYINESMFTPFHFAQALEIPEAFGDTYGLGVGTIYNYIDLEDMRVYVQLEQRKYEAGSNYLLSDGVKQVVKVPQYIYDVSDNGTAFTPFIKVAPGDILVFEDENGEIEAGVPYIIKYQRRI